jgi:predicted nucleic-acid-binding protein
LGAIQAYIARKTKYMDKFLILKGKLEMVSKTLEIKKNEKVVSKVEEKSKAAKGQALLVYKDADD